MFKALQILRIVKSVRNSNGRFVKIGSRVVVVNVKDSRVKARYGTTGNYQYLTAPVSAFTTAIRGRPVGSTKKVAEIVVEIPTIAE